MNAVKQAVEAKQALDAAKAAMEQALREIVEQYAIHAVGDLITCNRSASGKSGTGQVVKVRAVLNTVDALAGVNGALICYETRMLKVDGSMGNIAGYAHQRVDA